MPRVILVALAVFATIYAIVDCVMTDRSRVRVMSKVAWLLVCLVPVLGPMVWFVAGRTDRGTGGVLGDRRGGRPGGTQRGTTGSRRPKGPEDDPDFLRGLGRPDRP